MSETYPASADNTGGAEDQTPPLGEQFAAFADETREWAEHDLAAGVEHWPDDDWSEK
jgi:hypothetical protein